MGYEYDAFFSYKRDPLTNNWHKEVLSRLKERLRNELNKENVNIFFDNNSITSGDDWKYKIENALLKSKCLIAILSPRYFQSKWCYSEFQTFLERQKQLQKQGLIVPARYHDGDHYPQEAKDIQSIDFSQYTSTIAAFWESHKALDLEPHLNKFAKDISLKIKNAPSFQEDFPIKIVSDEDLIKYRIGRPVNN